MRMWSEIGSVRIECSYDFCQIDEVKIHCEPNDHAQATVIGLVKGPHKMELNDGSFDRLKIHDMHAENTLLFSGIVQSVRIKHKGDVFFIVIQASSCSVLLDLCHKRRSFQDKQASYRQLFEQVIVQDGGGQFFDLLSNGRAQERVMIQYDETDWEFVKRIASQLGGVVVPDLRADKAVLYLGLPQALQHDEDVNEREIQIQCFQPNTAQFHGGFCAKRSVTRYTIESTQYYRIGSNIQYQGLLWVVTNVDFYTENALVKKRYTLQRRSNVLQPMIKNPALCGLMLKGRVLDVMADKLKLHLEIDEKQALSSANWFPFNTPYTANGQTGFYWMPQKGELAYLYLPTDDENQALVRTLQRDHRANKEKIQNPSTKRMLSAHQKELNMAPSELELIGKHGVCRIQMHDDTGISITSEHDVVLTSESDVVFTGHTLAIQAAENIYFKSSNSSLTLDYMTHFKSDKITMNGFLKK